MPHGSTQNENTMTDGQTIAELVSASGTCSGVDLIAAERRRQVEAEGWTQHHDSQHKRGELAMAASCYANHAAVQSVLPNPADVVDYGTKLNLPHMWPWEEEWWKPSVDRIKNLVKAGALIAAEIDRLEAQRLLNTERTESAPAD